MGKTKVIGDLSCTLTRVVVVVPEEISIKLWDWQGNLITSFDGHQDVVIGIAFSANSKILATANYDKTIRFWNLQGKTIKTLREDNHSISATGPLAISPDGKQMVTSDLEGMIKLWQTDFKASTVDFKLNKNLRGHTESLRKIVFSPDGQSIASASKDSTIELWHRDGRLLKTLYGHDEPVWSISFSRDGKTLVSGSEDKTAIIWNLEEIFEQDLLAAGCNQIKDYLQTNADVSPSDRLLCDNLENYSAENPNLQKLLRDRQNFW